MEQNAQLLESRALLTAWIPQGPAPSLFGQVEEIDPFDEDQVSGAIHSVVAHPTDPDVLWIGSVNGGIWRTNDATSPGGPTWFPQTDNVESLSIGAIAIDPTDSDILVAGLGAHSSFSRDSDDLGGILVTTDGGNAWFNPGSVGLDTVAPAGESITGIAVRGTDIVVTSRLNFGGVFKSTDGGATFAPISVGGGFTSPGDDFWDLVEDPTDATHMRLYAAAEDDGIYRSDDFGSTWTAITGPAINAEMDAIISNSANNNTEMAVSPVTGRLFTAIIIDGRPEAIFYSDDADTATPSWIRMDVPVLPNAAPLAIDTASATAPVIITTTTAHGLDFGDRVVISGVTGNSGALGNFAITPISATTFELDFSVGTGVGTGGTVTPVVGLSPTGNKPGSQGGLHFAIVADPTDPDVVYVGGDRQDAPFPTATGATSFSGALFRGDTSIAADPTAIPSPQWDHLTHDAGGLGGTFDPPGGTASGSAPHADARDMVFDALGNLVEVDDGGIYVRTSPEDNTGDWFSLNGNLQITEMHDVAFDPIHGTIISGNQDTGTTYQPAPAAEEWISLTTADGGDVAVAPMTGTPGTSVRFSSFQFLGDFVRTTWSSPGSPDSFDVIDTSFIPDKQFVTPIALNSVDPTRLAIGGAGAAYESVTGVDVTVDPLGPGSFSAVFGSGPVNRNAIAFGHASDPDLLVIGSGGFIGIRPGPVGSFMGASPAAIPGGDFVQDVIIDPAPFAPFPTFFAATDTSSDPGMVWISTDGATFSWTDITGNLPTLGSNVQQLEYVEVGPGLDALIAATNNGVFFLPESPAGFAASAASGSWTELGAGLPNGLAYDLDYDPGADVLVVGTMGRGAWLLPGVTTAVTGPSTDFGDAPDSYLTLEASGGASHVAIGPVLGLASDTEPDAATPLDGTSDGFDEDGIIFGGVFTAGATETVIVDVLSGPALLNAFVDFDGDGTFGAGEEIAIDVPVNSGPNALSFSIPSGAVPGATFSRFRISTAPLFGSPAGPADDGEVEDYEVTIAAATSDVDIELTQTESIDPVIAGSGIGNLTYVVTATNNGPGAASGVVIDESMTLPVGVSVDSITPSAGGFTGTTWTLGTLAPGTSATLTVVLTVAPSAIAGTDVIGSTATVIGVTETDTVPGNDSTTAVTSIAREVDIELSTTESTDPVVAGSGPGNLTYVVTASNNGPSNASGVAVTEALTLPAGVTIDSVTASGGTSFVDPTWTIGDLGSGASETLTIVLTVDGSALPGTDVISDTATVTAVTETDTVPGNDSVTEATSIVTLPVAAVDIELTKTESIDPVIAGSGIGNLTYVVTATNNGPGAATGVVIDESLTLPVGVSVDAITPSAGGFAGTTWTLGLLGAGASETLTVVLTVDPSATEGTDVISNTATLTGVTQTDTVPGNNTVTEATSIARLVDIELTATESIDPVVAGSGPGNLTYVVTATNNGPSNASGVAVAEAMTLPAGVTLDSVTASLGTSFADPTWTVGDLASGASATLTIVLTVDGTAIAGTDVISDTATVTAVGETDTVLANDAVTESTSITTGVGNFSDTIDDGDVGYSTTGTWYQVDRNGHDGDFQYAVPDGSADEANWLFSGLTAGKYRVSVSYRAWTNRATDAPYTVFDGASPLTTLVVNQKVVASDRVVSGTKYHDLGVFDITSGALDVLLTDDADGVVSADSVHIERIIETVLGPEITVLMSGLVIDDDTGVADFGNVEHGSTQIRTITIENPGTADLTISTPVLPTGFTFASTPPVSTVPAGGSTSFDVEIDTSVLGAVVSGEITFDTNDVDEDPFNFTVTGKIIPAIQIIDNGDTGYATTGVWTTVGRNGHLGDFDFAAPGTGSSEASFTFDVSAGSTYRVYAAWRAHTNRATDAEFRIHDGALGPVVSTVVVNQKMAPAPDHKEGSSRFSVFEELGTVSVSGTELSVQLSDLADGFVIADAIRIERIG